MPKTLKEGHYAGVIPSIVFRVSACSTSVTDWLSTRDGRENLDTSQPQHVPQLALPASVGTVRKIWGMVHTWVTLRSWALPTPCIHDECVCPETKVSYR
jgi:hypothetical protein